MQDKLVEGGTTGRGLRVEGIVMDGILPKRFWLRI